MWPFDMRYEHGTSGQIKLDRLRARSAASIPLGTAASHERTGADTYIFVRKTHIADWFLHINAVRAGIECVRNEFLGVKREFLGVSGRGSPWMAASSDGTDRLDQRPASSRLRYSARGAYLSSAIDIINVGQKA